MRTKEQQTKIHVESIRATNRPVVEAALRYRRNKGCKSGTLVNYAWAFRLLDEFLDGRPYDSVSRHDLAAFVETLRDRYASASVYTYTASLKANLKFAFDAPMLAHDLADALTVRQPGKGPKPGVLISRDDFEALLRACKQRLRRKHPRAGVMMQCLLWMLWATGFRISELLSMNCGHVRLEEHGAKLVLPDLAEGLKTGPRTIYIHEATPILKAWLSLHPAPGKESPLFIGLRDSAGITRLAYQTVEKHLHYYGDDSGVNIGRDKPVTAHDFRHTLATRKVRDHQWTEMELRAYFGWAPGSSMPSYYVHLANGDLRDRVLRDAGVDELGRPEVLESSSDAEQLAALLKRLTRSD